MVILWEAKLGTPSGSRGSGLPWIHKVHEPGELSDEPDLLLGDPRGRAGRAVRALDPVEDSRLPPVAELAPPAVGRVFAAGAVASGSCCGTRCACWPTVGGGGRRWVADCLSSRSGNQVARELVSSIT